MNGLKKIVAAAVLALSAGTASATPVQWSGNGHWYEVITGSYRAVTAFANAATHSYLGETGYVVTITSQAEQDFVFSTFGGSARYWIGSNDVASEGNWVWTNSVVNDGAVVYNNWAPGEPNNQYNAQHYAIMLQNGKWSDVAGNSSNHLYSYVIEYYGTLPAVPAPAGLPLAAGALGLLAMLKRRKKA